MSTPTHNFQIGQRVVIANPPANVLELAGLAGIYFGIAEPPANVPQYAGLAGLYYGDSPDGLYVRLDINGWTYACQPEWLEPEPQTKVTDMPSLEELRDAFYNPADPQADTSLDAALQRVAELVWARR